MSFTPAQYCSASAALAEYLQRMYPGPACFPAPQAARIVAECFHLPLSHVFFCMSEAPPKVYDLYVFSDVVTLAERALLSSLSQHLTRHDGQFGGAKRAHDATNICKQFAQKGRCSFGSRCLYFHTPPSQENSTMPLRGKGPTVQKGEAPLREWSAQSNNLAKR